MIRSNRKWILLSVVLVALGSSGFVIGYVQNWLAERAAAAASPPHIVTIGYGDIVNAIPAAGILQAVGEPDEADAPGSQGEVPASLIMVAHIYDNEIAAVDDAVEIYFTLVGGDDRRWRGEGLRVNPVPDMSAGIARYTVRFDVDNQGGDLWPGLEAQVYFVTSAVRNVLTVPMGALTLGPASGDTRRATVETVRPNGGTERRDVVVRAMDRVNAEVVSGLEEGDRVVAGAFLAPADLSGRPGDFRGGRGRGREQQFEERFFEPAPDAR